MSGEKYIGLDVHQATISVAVMDSQKGLSLSLFHLPYARRGRAISSP
jgi:hypothetical protein